MAVSVGEIEATLRLRDELTGQLAKAEQSMKQFGQTSESVNKLISKFGGGDAIRSALDYAEAVAKVGGVSRLTADHQLELARALDAANAQFRVMGKEAPEQFKKLGDQLIALNRTDTPGLIDRIKGAFQNLGPSIATFAASFATALISVDTLKIGMQALIGFVKDSISQYLEAEKAQRKLTAALVAQNTATPETISGYKRLADEFQRTTVFSDDLITEMQTLLVTVGRVMPSEMEAALQASTNLASGLGIDLRQATMLVAKSFEDNFTSLKRYGVEIDEARAKSEGMTYVLGQLNERFGGQAAADLRTFSGQLQNLGNAFDEVKEAIGGVIINSPIVQALFLALRVEVTSTLKELEFFIIVARQLASVPGPVGVAFKVLVGDLKSTSDSMAEVNARVAEFNRLRSGGMTAQLPTDYRNWSRALADAKKEISELEPWQRKEIDAALELGGTIKGTAAGYMLSADAQKIYQSVSKELNKVDKERVEAQKNLNSSLNDLNDTQIKLIESKLREGKSQSDIARVYGFTAQQVDDLAEQLKEVEQVEKKVAEQRHKQSEAIKELNSGLHTLSKEQFDMISTEIKAGKVQNDIAEAYKFTAQEVRAVDQELKLHDKTLSTLTKIEEKYWKDQIKFADTLGKQTFENLKKIMNAEQDLADLRATVGATSIQQSIIQIKRWAEEQIEAFKGSAEEAARFKAIIDQIAGEKIAALAPSLAKAKAVLFDMANEFPNVLANAIINGEGIGEALEAVLAEAGGKLGNMFGKSLSKLGSQMGEFLGAAFGALGSIGGAMLGKAFNALISINKNVTKETREEFAKSMGFDNLGKLYDDLRTLGTQGQQLANIGLNIIGRKDETANKKWMKDVQGFYDMIQKEIGEVEKAISRTDILWTREMQTFIKNSPAFAEAIKGQLNSALGGLSQFLSSGSDLLAVKSDEMAQAIGGTIAAVFDKLRSSGVGMKAALEAVQPALDALDQQLKKAGLDGGEALGSIRGMLALAKDEIVGPFLSGVEGATSALLGLNNSGLLNQATFSALTGSIGESFNLLVSQGKDADQLLRLMAGPLQTIWELQKDFGFAVDDATKALLEQAEVAGVVGDKQRDPMERMIKALDRMTFLLEQIAVKFGAIPSEAAKAADGIDSAFSGKEIEVPVKFKWGDFRPPSGDIEVNAAGFQGGTHGKYLDFGSGTPAILHGKERIMTEGESEAASSGGMLQPIIINLDGLKFLEVMARTAHRHGAVLPLTYS